MTKIVLIRHGQSQWNLENRFTGWVDVELSERGIREAREAGMVLQAEGYTFDVAFTSYLKRAIRTLWLIMEETGQMWLPVQTDWRLNERHYGALQGLNKKETAEKYGEEQVHKWRRGYATRPPALEPGDAMHPGNATRYAKVHTPPATESLADTMDRVVPYWNDTIIPALKAGQKPIITAHGNSLRALVKHLDGLSEDAIMGVNIPTGIPLVYELNEKFEASKSYYLADQDKIAAAAAEVKNQTKT